MTKRNVNTLNAEKMSEDVVLAVTEFRSFFKKSVVDVLEMGRVVQRVKKTRPTQFDSFCKAIGFASKSSSIKKLKRIGDKFDLLMKFAKSLPANWTSLYQITKLESERIDELIQSGAIHSQVRGAEIVALQKKITNEIQEEKVSSKKIKEVQSGTRGCAFTCELLDISDATLNAKILKLLSQLQRMSSKVKVTETEDFKRQFFPVMAEAA